MAFTWVHKKKVESDDGYSVQMTGMHSWEYCESERRMSLEGEFTHGDHEGRGFGYTFYPTWRAANWQPPHQSLPLSASDRLRIRSNIIEAIAFMNGKATFD